MPNAQANNLKISFSPNQLMNGEKLFCLVSVILSAMIQTGAILFFSNIAYNLQYLEYLNRCFEEQYLTSVLRAQNVKMFTLTSSQIIECLLFLKLVELGVDKN